MRMLPAEKHDELEQLFTDLANEMEEVVGESAVVDVEACLLEQLLARRQRREISLAVMSAQTRLVQETRSAAPPPPSPRGRTAGRAPNSEL